MLAKVRTPSGATCKGVLQLEASFIDVKFSRDWNPGLELGKKVYLLKSQVHVLLLNN